MPQDIRKQKSALGPQEFGNPVSATEATDLVHRIRQRLPSTLPQYGWLATRLNSSETFVGVLGDEESIFGFTVQAYQAFTKGTNTLLMEATLTQADVQLVYERSIGKNDEFFTRLGLNRQTFTSSAFLNTVMTHLKIPKIHYRRLVSGSTLGVLISPEFWTANTK